MIQEVFKFWNSSGVRIQGLSPSGGNFFFPLHLSVTRMPPGVLSPKSVGRKYIVRGDISLSTERSPEKEEEEERIEEEDEECEEGEEVPGEGIGDAEGE